MKQTVLLAAEDGWRRDLYITQLMLNPVDEFVVFTATSLDGLYHLRNALDLSQTLPSNGVPPIVVVMQSADYVKGNLLEWEDQMSMSDLTAKQIYREFESDVASGAIDTLFHGVLETDYFWSSIQWARAMNRVCQRPSPRQRHQVAV